jgi:ribosome biogenesis protein UTP30
MSIRTDLLNPANVSKATHALLTWTKKSSDSAQLFAEDDDAFVYLNYVLDRAVSQEHVLRFPVRIPGLAHPLYSGENKGKGACLIVGDKKFAKVSELLEANPVDGISRVMSLKEIRLDYQQFKDRRELVSQFDLFLVDYAVREVAAKSMGKIFFSRKKYSFL